MKCCLALPWCCSTCKRLRIFLNHYRNLYISLTFTVLTLSIGIMQLNLLVTDAIAKPSIEHIPIVTEKMTTRNNCPTLEQLSSQSCLPLIPSLLLSSSHKIFNQNTNQTDQLVFKSYEDNNLTIRIEYPSTWKPITLQPLFDVLFVPPSENEHIPRVGFGLKVVDLPIEIISDHTPESLFNSAITFAPTLLKKVIPDFSFRGSDREPVGDMPARSIRFFGYIGEGHKAVQLTFLANHDQLYLLTYFTQKNHFMEHFSVAKRMLDSFEIISKTPT